jgi:hypothetical protein
VIISQVNEGKYDVIVCFETLEHLDDDKAFIDSLPVNTLVIFSVPDKNYAWASPFHKRACDKKILEERFRNFGIEYFFQHPNGEIDDVETGVQNIIGVCKKS